MESNEQTELMRKTETGSEMESRWQWGRGSLGDEQMGERTQAYGQQCDDCWREEGIRGVNGNGKNDTY